VINADAVQLYKGLDIPCNKVTGPEQATVKHHLLDMLDPTETWTVHDYHKAATPIIDDICSRGKLPVLCGGTNYYIQSLLWPSLMTDRGDEEPGAAEGREEDGGAGSQVGEAEAAYRRLREVDPEMAIRLHPANLRKVLRSLEVFDQTGRKHSELIAEQQTANLKAAPLYDACIFWIHCEQQVLDNRLDGRVAKMIERGMLGEIQEFRSLLVGFGHPFNFTKGILQAIGFKEFAPYLDLSEQEREEPAGQVLLKECIVEVERSTRKYAKRQLTWIRNRTLRMRPAVPIYQLDGSDIARWDETVVNPALKVVESLQEQRPLPQEFRVELEEPLDDASKHQQHHCELCTKTVRGSSEWQAHLKSRAHRRAGEKQRKKRRGAGAAEQPE